MCQVLLYNINFVFEQTQTAYQYFKLEIAGTKGSDVMQIGEFALTNCEHSWGTPVTTAPTCTNAGVTGKTCSVCGGTILYDHKPQLDHDFTGEDGKCIYCNYTYDELLQSGYLDENGRLSPQKTMQKSVNGTDTSWTDTEDNSDWYMVTGDVTIGSRVTVSGDVHLILMNGCKLTVNGGIRVEGTNKLTIYAQSTGDSMGELVANASGTNNAGIGGNGGTVTANSTYGSGIGYGKGIQIESGTGYNGGNGTFRLNNGNAVIFASSIADQSNKSSWNRIIFEGGNDGIIYGTDVAPTDDFTIPTGKTLTIGANQNLTISEGVTATNEGTITNNGKIFVDGTFTGTLTGTGSIYYALTVSGGTADTIYSYNSKSYATAGSEISLTPDTPTGYEFKQWNSVPTVTISENKFTMPSAAVKINALFDPLTYYVTFVLNGGTINSGHITGYTFGQGATLPTDVTKAGYIFKGWYDNENLTGSPVTAISETETEDKEYWAKWEESTYNVTLNTNGGTINSGNIDKYTCGQGVTLPTDVTKAGYTFKGWYNNENLTGSPVTAISETETEDKEYWAKW